MHQLNVNPIMFAFIIIIIIVIVIVIVVVVVVVVVIGFSVYLHNSPGDITQFNNKSMQKTEKF